MTENLNMALELMGQGMAGIFAVLGIIALLVDGNTDALGAMTGKLGNIPGVKVRSVLLTAAGRELSPKEDS